MKLPNEPRPGDPVQAQTIIELIRYARSITPQPSATVLVKTTANGTTFDALPPRVPAPSDG